ncbi:MAG: dUTP diphosphatase [Flavobacteriaceae bacterium]|nr:dUTP diphosphatase [Flavobacteriaceae bacterium]
MKLTFARVRDGMPEPSFAHDGDAGLDLYCAEDVFIPKNTFTMIPTGVAVAIPKGYYGMLVPRSSTFKKYGFIFPNSVGIIDSGYRGELFGTAYRLDADPQIPKEKYVEHYTLKKGTKFAQLIIHKIPKVELEEKKSYELSETKRGKGGFGSTGN